MPPERYRGALLLPRALTPLFLSFELFIGPARLLHRFHGNSGGAARHSSAEPPPPLRQSGATGPCVSTARSSPPRSPPARSGSSSPFCLSWSSSSSSSSMAQPSGSWRGSYMREDDIERLVRLRRIPAGDHEGAGVEVEPRPEPGERVVFGAHLDRGLGLPASTSSAVLDFLGLQPHHLPANAFILLSCYVAFMEGYAALWPGCAFWSRLFYIKGADGPKAIRGPAAPPPYILARSRFPRIRVDSEDARCRSSMRNDNPAFDRLNLPEYNPAPPSAGSTGPQPGTADPDAEVNLWDFLGECVTGADAGTSCTYPSAGAALQACPQDRAHVGRLDPTRTSKVELTKAQVARRVNNITKANMGELGLGLPPYDRASPPELVKDRTPDHVDPVTSDQAGDDDLPVVPDQGGRGSTTRRLHRSTSRSRRSGESVRGLSLRCPALEAHAPATGGEAGGGGSTAKAEARAKRRVEPKKVPRRSPGRRLGRLRAEPTLSRREEESTPRSSMRAPVVIVRCGHLRAPLRRGARVSRSTGPLWMKCFRAALRWGCGGGRQCAAGDRSWRGCAAP
ncbi:hypothetical protein QYE76_025234 [Lolium multiflorum]|uniref:Transposase (putative) gypsy type domain-containing protein n=1 Tax=Lolium multiflorum TaxID=4521 RepID=A0AAD8RET0_LOLMU|nr:hypothetical protein QYE76_025234 [Lolium multiflorum]